MLILFPVVQREILLLFLQEKEGKQLAIVNTTFIYGCYEYECCFIFTGKRRKTTGYSKY